MSDATTARQKRTGSLLPFVRGAFWTSVLFSAVMAVLLTATFVQLRLHDPIDSPALVRLIARLQNEPHNAQLREQVRALDLLARKAYFTGLWQVRAGAMLLVLGIAVAILSWKAHRMLAPEEPSPPGATAAAWWERRTLSRKALVASGAAIVVVALGSAVFIRGELAARSRMPGAGPPAPFEELRTHWPGFRGPEGNGIASHANAPLSWDGETMAGIRWKVRVPRPGNSSPVVWKERVFVTGGDDQTREVYCFSSVNGKLLWRHDVRVPATTSQPEPDIDAETGYAAPTPACDGRRVFAIFPTGELVCLDLEGNRVWAKNLGVPQNHYGHASSLITHDGMLYVQYDGKEGLLALDNETGELVWKVKRDRLTWSSPICVNTGRRRELIVADNERVTSYAPRDGRELWSHDCLYGEVGPSPAHAAGRVFVATEYSPAAGIIAHDPDAGDSSRILWRWDEDLPNTASPVATERCVFFATAGGAVGCVDAATGSTHWSKTFDNGFYSSPLIAGERVYLMDRTGIMRIFAADTEYRSIGAPSLGEPSVATPAILDGFMIVRGDHHLFRIEGDGDG
jgi:outer membrane protein assembly factor BamB